MLLYTSLEDLNLVNSDVKDRIIIVGQHVHGCAGASVESFWYSRVIERLAKHGYVTASSDYYRAFSHKTSILPSKSSFRQA